MPVLQLLLDYFCAKIPSVEIRLIVKLKGMGCF